MRTIVVGYDETPAADRALKQAAAFAKSFGSMLIVTSVAPLLTPGPKGIGGPDPADPPERHKIQLRHARERLGREGIEAECVTGFGDPAKKIVELAERRHADMILVGTREPGVVERLLGASVSGGVARRAHCDVYIVH